jgi:UDP-N-acetylglucosamine acyltransferase
MGSGNDVHPYAVLGGDPQDRAMDPLKRNAVIIGNDNIIREHVTIHRGTGDGAPTRLGSGCMLMACSHIGHNCQVGDRVIMANSVMLAGHVRMGDGCVLGGNVGVHQFVNVGDGVMMQGQAGASSHVPPYTVIAGINGLVGLNAIGLRRNPAFTPEQRAEVKEAFRAVYRLRGGGSLEGTVLELLERPWGPPAMRFLTFIRDCLREPKPRNRGMCRLRSTRARPAAFEELG